MAAVATTPSAPGGAGGRGEGVATLPGTRPPLVFLRCPALPHSGSIQSEKFDIEFWTKTANFDVYYDTFSIARCASGRKFHKKTNGIIFRTSKFCINGVTSI